MRERVCRHVVDMRVDLAQLLANPQCSAEQLQMFAELDASLAGNLEHILAGHSLAELPMPIEAVEVDEPESLAEVAAEAEVPVEPEPVELPVPPESSEAARSPGLLVRVRDWLSEPWDGSSKRR